ncbi:J domain-containing protein [Vagococcus hydrophili]|uniref:J domain-containing protein n=1 Tax=Vagococcus hydrophili TaxID=2714947 RepID=A0A6G8AUV0_9ENTE|nr:hypothetical protein [Vagococcus hydrophili]QIL48715.1 hypothetical protein G7082_09455 [Vagococcus hydrophili]
MDIYEILGITKDASIDEIRGAYSAKLKTIDMSKNIEDYQNLRAAYNEALKIINNRCYEPTSSTSSTVVTPEIEKDIKPTETVNKPEISTPKVEESPSEELPIKEEKKMAIENLANVIQTKKETISQPEPVKEIEPIKDQPKQNSQPTTNEKAHFIQELTPFLAEKTYFNDSEGWHNLIKKFLSSGEDKVVLTTIKIFLLKNYMLLDDRTRHEIINLCDLTESSFNSTEDIITFREHISPSNHLDYDCYAFMPVGIREEYFKLRYELHRSIQVEDVPFILSEGKMKQIHDYPYKDEDLLYLLSVSALLNQTRLTAKDAKLYLSKIQSDKYHHDLAHLQKYAQFLDNNHQIMISNSEIIGLTWVSDGVKEQLMNQVRQIKQHNKPKRPVKNGVPYQPNKGSQQPNKLNIWKIIAILIVVLITSLFLVTIMSPRESGYNFEDEFETMMNHDDDGDDDDELSYLVDSRTHNIKLNYDVYNNLFEEGHVLSNSKEAFTKDALADFVKIKKEKADILSDFDSMDAYSNAYEAHYLTEDNQVITFVSFTENEDFNLKVTANEKNEITKIESLEANDMPENKSFGTMDAATFFFGNISMRFQRFDQYKKDLEMSYSQYLTDDVYDTLDDIDQETFDFLNTFSFSRPYLIKVKDKNVLVFKDYNENLLVLDLDEDYKISNIYGEHFEELPKDYQEAIKKIKFNTNTVNPWAITIGYPV